MNKIHNRLFTLIELLVVLAVIGILISILLPSLSRARKVSKQAVSMSNLKQIHVATMAYATNNNNWLFDHSTNWHPHAGINRVTGGRNSVMDWERMAYESMIGKTLNREEASELMAPNTAYYQTFFCPVLRDSRPERTNVSTYGEGDYSMNRHFITHRNLAKLVGEIEPIYVGGEANNNDPGVASDDFRNGTYDPTGEKRPAYQYINQQAIGLFINGSVKTFSKSKGAEIHTAITNHHNFE